MSDGTAIEWTDATWNIVNGCTVLSPGCTNCYAMRLAGTRLKHHPSRAGLTIDTKASPVWTGEVRFNDKVLLDPLKWRRPRKIFVCAHGDLFHENVPDEWIDRIFAVMALAPQHTFQVLTKRPERMWAYIRGFWQTRLIRHLRVYDPVCQKNPGYGVLLRTTDGVLPNVWLGTSVEDQKRADERIPILLDTPAALRWLSCEPLLGPVNLTIVAPYGDGGYTHALRDVGQRIDWVVVGGESGPNARAMHPAWARSLRDQCASAGIPFLFKQWGEWAPSTPDEARPNPRSGWRTASGKRATGPRFSELYPENGAAFVAHVGKKATGRLLDGVEHDGYPA